MIISKYHGIKKGFTLIEMLVVLTITTFILMISTFSLKETIVHTKERAFIQSYHRILKLSQLEAMSRTWRVPIQYRYPRSYVLMAPPFTPICMEVPKSILRYPKKTIIYNPNGSTKAQTIVFESLTYRYLLVFQIGKGNFRYEERRMDSY